MSDEKRDIESGEPSAEAGSGSSEHTAASAPPPATSAPPAYSSSGDSTKKSPSTGGSKSFSGESDFMKALKKNYQDAEVARKKKEADAAKNDTNPIRAQLAQFESLLTEFYYWRSENVPKFWSYVREKISPKYVEPPASARYSPHYKDPEHHESWLSEETPRKVSDDYIDIDLRSMQGVDRSTYNVEVLPVEDDEVFDPEETIELAGYSIEKHSEKDAAKALLSEESSGKSVDAEIIKDEKIVPVAAAREMEDPLGAATSPIKFRPVGNMVKENQINPELGKSKLSEHNAKDDIPDPDSQEEHTDRSSFDNS